MYETGKKDTRQLNLDSTNIGRAMNSLQSLKNRWEDKKELIGHIYKELEEIRALLTEDGPRAYDPQFDKEFKAKRKAKLEGKKIKEEANKLEEEAKALVLKKEEEEKAKAERIEKLKTELKELQTSIE